MRKSACICFVFVMMYAVTIAAYAQPMPPRRGQESHRKEIRTPEEIAKIKTERLQKEVILDDKQFKKIYKIYLKEEQAKQQAMEGNMMPPPGGFPGGMPSGGPGGGFPGGGRPPQGGGPGMGHGTPPHAMFGDMAVPTVGGKAIDSDEYIDSREKKFRKILTPEQYERFRSIHPDPSGFFMD